MTMFIWKMPDSSYDERWYTYAQYIQVQPSTNTIECDNHTIRKHYPNCGFISCHLKGSILVVPHCSQQHELVQLGQVDFHCKIKNYRIVENVGKLRSRYWRRLCHPDVEKNIRKWWIASNQTCCGNRPRKVSSSDGNKTIISVQQRAIMVSIRIFPGFRFIVW